MAGQEVATYREYLRNIAYEADFCPTDSWLRKHESAT